MGGVFVETGEEEREEKMGNRKVRRGMEGEGGGRMGNREVREGKKGRMGENGRKWE